LLLFVMFHPPGEKSSVNFSYSYRTAIPVSVLQEDIVLHLIIG